MRVTLNNWLVYHLGTARRGSWKTVKGFLETLQKYISDSPIWLRICCKFISSIAFIWIKIYHENPLGNHDVPRWQNAYACTFSGKGASLYLNKCIFQCRIMFCNQNKRQKQSSQMICDRVTMICQNCPQVTISFLWWFCTFKHILQTTDYNICNEQGNTWDPKWYDIFDILLDVQ